MELINILTQEFNIKQQYVKNIIELIDEGNTIPFIARYRKELTGALDDQILREFYERLTYLKNLNEKRDTTKKLIEEQGNLTKEIEDSLNSAKTMSEIDDIYRPFKPKRSTRATVAKEKGLESIATLIWEQKENDILNQAKNYIDQEKELNTVEDVINGAKDIVCEIISDDPKYRKIIRDITFKKGYITSSLKKGKENSVYEMYYEYTEMLKTVASHRILALNRGEKEKVLNVKIEPPIEEILKKMETLIIKNNKATDNILKEIIEDSYKRLIMPSIEREIRSEFTEKAMDGAIKVFGENLRQLLMEPPIQNKVVLAIDPAFRTGCKFALIDQIGKVLETGVVYPTEPKNDIEGAKKKLLPLIKKYKVNIIAIGNGTASRETEQFVTNMMKEIESEIYYIIVNEAGASVYSASKLGAEEFPDFDVALRSAVSIGRRLQDPLSELVKIDPKSIGVGQYQHDMEQKKLSNVLGGVVEGTVNNVGVDLNTASPSLLSYVSGISKATAKNIIEYKELNGKFKNRKELLKVKKLGPKAYLQCAGFLKITDGENPLDCTSVHPESYEIAKNILNKSGYTLEDIKNKNIKNLKSNITSIENIAKDLNVGVLTVEDIINELEKPGRDPREDMPKPILRVDVLEMKDLQVGMVLKGVIRNVIDFGVFVDIGVHQDGLVHISQITDKFIKHPLEVVKVSDVVNVKILSVDIEKKRISLSMKGIE